MVLRYHSGKGTISKPIARFSWGGYPPAGPYKTSNADGWCIERRSDHGEKNAEHDTHTVPCHATQNRTEAPPPL